MKLSEAPHTWAEFSSSQLLQNTPLHPIAEWGRQRFAADEPRRSTRLADLENTLRLIGLDHAEYAPLLAPLYWWTSPCRPSASKLAPHGISPPATAPKLRRRRRGFWRKRFRSQPVVQAFEDLALGGSEHA